MPADRLSQYLCLLQDDESVTFRSSRGPDGKMLEITIRKHSNDSWVAIVESISMVAAVDANFNLITHSFRRCLMTLRKEGPRDPFKETP